MKNIIFIFLATVLVNSCSKDQSITPGLVGKWKLKEILADPGDGTGEFMSVQSSKTITFFKDSTVTSNGELCQFSTEADQSSSGEYSPDQQLIILEYCSSSGSSKINYVLSGDELILSYRCIEPCRQKFVKIN